MASADSTMAIVFGGGGARTAYEAGAMRYIAESFPGANVEIVLGLGAGALNAYVLASNPEPWPAPAHRLVQFWSGLTRDRVFRPRSLWDLVTQMVKRAPSRRQSLLDSSPLRNRLDAIRSHSKEGQLRSIQHNIEDGWLETFAVPTTQYGTLETVLWTQGQSVERTERPRISRTTTVTVDHILAAASLALLYPAVSIGEEWHGAGVGFRRPVRAAIDLGADAVIALSTRSADPEPSVHGTASYPSPLQVASILSNTLVLDVLSTSAGTRPGASRGDASGKYDLAGANLLTVHPSVDPTSIADGLDVDVDATLGTVIRYLHGQAMPMPDLLSMLLFDPRYLRRLLLLGYEDARRRHEDIEQFLVS